MEHFIRIAFWIFTLIFTLSGCKSTPIPLSTEDFDFNIKFLRDITCQPDTKLYSPKDVMPKCFTSALECVQKELKTATYECEDGSERIGQGMGALRKLIDVTKLKTGSVPTTSNECACEKWAAVPFDEFLNNYERLTELIVTNTR